MATKKKSMKSAGKSKAAVMNSRNPKKPMAISGDTMSNYAMYKKGGSKLGKYQGPERSQVGPRTDNSVKYELKSIQDDEPLNVHAPP